MVRPKIDKRFLMTSGLAMAIILSILWMSTSIWTPRERMPRAEEVRYVKVLDRSTGRRYTVWDMKQIETILRCLPGGRKMMYPVSGSGFLLEFVCRGSGGTGTMQYVLNASRSLRHKRNLRYCEEYLQYLFLRQACRLPS